MNVYDSTGRIFQTERLGKASLYQMQVDLSKMPTGSYYLKVGK